MSRAAWQWMLPVLWLAGCAGSLRPETKSETRPEVIQPTPHTYTVTVTHDRKAVIREEALTIELTDVKDSRCPRDVRCIWAGHAAVMLRVGLGSAAAEPVVIGTPAPEGMGLPSAAMLDAYRFSLPGLVPEPVRAGPISLSRYRATVEIVRLAR